MFSVQLSNHRWHGTTSINEGSLIDCDFKCHSILGMTIDIYYDILSGISNNV